MPAFRSAPALLAALLFAGGCATPWISAGDRKETCRIAVQETFGPPEYEANAMSGGAGTLAGAGKGAWYGMGFGYGSLITMPLGFLIGAGYGTACAVSGAQHRAAEADFARWLREADTGIVRRTLEARAAEPRAACPGPRAVAPQAVVHIERIAGGMGCMVGNQDFWIAVKWRTVSASKRVLNEGTTRVERRSSLGVDAWFADPAQAKADIALVLGQVAQAMATQFQDPPPDSPK